MKIRAILTGATGMVGEGVLHECLQHGDVEHILVINRKPCGIQHPKLREVIHADFFDLSSIASQLTGYNTCFFCLGVSAVGMSEQEYYMLTYSLTLHVAGILVKQNSDMVLCYISGAGTDSTGRGRIMWARIKGKTENDLMKLPFKKVYAFRPGYMQPTKGLKNTLRSYKYIQLALSANAKIVTKICLYIERTWPGYGTSGNKRISEKYPGSERHRCIIQTGIAVSFRCLPIASCN